MALKGCREHTGESEIVPVARNHIWSLCIKENVQRTRGLKGRFVAKTLRNSADDAAGGGGDREERRAQKLPSECLQPRMLAAERSKLSLEWPQKGGPPLPGSLTGCVPILRGCAACAVPNYRDR